MTPSLHTGDGYVMTPASRTMAQRAARALPRMRAGFVQAAELMGHPEWEQQREAEIKALPDAVWHGRPLKTLRCSACGKDQNVPEMLLWALASITGFICRACSLRPTPKNDMPLFSGAEE